jgi:hypothetical protein
LETASTCKSSAIQPTSALSSPTSRININYHRYKYCKKGKAVPQHIYRGSGGRGGIAPTHSRPQHWMGVSGQRHASAALYPWRKYHQYPLDRRLGGPQGQSRHRG